MPVPDLVEGRQEMKAVGYSHHGPIDADGSLEDIELDDPVPGPLDLLVQVRAISVNPVDVKIRSRVSPEAGYKVIGWDASGVVRAVGRDVTRFRAGDDVFYAGALDRPGTNSELHIVDERIVGRKPASLSHRDAAALPLTSITAWELLFDRFEVPEGSGEHDTLLVIGGAGGVGSMLIQLARTFTRLNVVATASRPETVEWCRRLGAQHVISHREDMRAELQALNIAPRYVAGLTGTDAHFPVVADIIAPQGKFGVIDDPDPSCIDIRLLKRKAISLHWEFMFTRSLFQTADMDAQHQLLCRVADAIDDGSLVTTANRTMGRITAAHLKAAHAYQETGAAIGKTVLEGF